MGIVHDRFKRVYQGSEKRNAQSIMQSVSQMRLERVLMDQGMCIATLLLRIYGWT
jgi:hypothetical protein